jgi:hypothetical protein
MCSLLSCRSMADAPPPQTAKERLLAKLMAECRQKLHPEEFELVHGHRQVLLGRDIVSPATVRRLSYEQLLEAGLTPGVADLLKSVFPSAGGCQRVQATSCTCVGAHAMFASVCFHSLHQHCHFTYSMHPTLNACYTGDYACILHGAPRVATK